jgi:DNA-binding transcriptional LysR family regulator
MMKEKGGILKWNFGFYNTSWLLREKKILPKRRLFCISHSPLYLVSLCRWRSTSDDLAGVPIIIARRQSVRNELENWFGYDKEKLHVALTCNLSHYNQPIMVESGIGVALVMEFACNQDTLCLRPLEPEIESGCLLVWKKNLTLSPAMQRFREYVKGISWNTKQVLDIEDNVL